MAVAHALNAAARIKMQRVAGRQHGHKAVQHGHVQRRPLPRARAADHRRQDGDHGVKACGDVAQGLAHLQGLAAVLAGRVHPAGHGLHDDVIGRQFRRRPRLAEARDRADHETRVPLPQAFRAQAQPLGHAGTEVLHHHVAGARDSAGERLPVGRLEVDDDRFLAPVRQREQGGFAVPEGADVAVIVALRRFQLDDLGAQVGQDRGGEGPRQHPRQVKDAQTVQRLHRASSGARASSRERISPSGLRMARALAGSRSKGGASVARWVDCASSIWIA